MRAHAPLGVQMMRPILVPVIVLAASTIASVSANAQDTAAVVIPAAETAAADTSAAAAFDVAVGAMVTSDYMFRGITQTDHMPAFQPYVEPSYGMFYAGVWGSNVDFLTPDPDVEIDLYAGLRPEFGPLSMNFSYLYYLYPDATETDYSELKGSIEFSPTDMISIGGEADYAWDYAQLGDDSLYFEGKATLSLPHDISASAAVGYQTYGTNVGLSDYLTWNVGASYTWKALTFDLRYYDTDISRTTCGAEYPRDNACDARIVASVSVASTLRDLGLLGSRGN